MYDIVKAFEIRMAALYGIPQEREGRRKVLPDFAKELLDYVNSPEYQKLIDDEIVRIKTEANEKRGNKKGVGI